MSAQHNNSPSNNNEEKKKPESKCTCGKTIKVLYDRILCLEQKMEIIRKALKGRN